MAALTLGVANSTVVVMFGQECGLYDQEKKLLYPSLSRVINRMPASSAAKASVFIDPLVLLLGVAIWTSRIVSIKSKQRTEANAVTAREFAAASGISWDATKGPAAANNPANRGPQPPGPPGDGTTPVPPEAGVNPADAGGFVGGVPDAIRDGRYDDSLNGPG